MKFPASRVLSVLIMAGMCVPGWARTQTSSTHRAAERRHRIAEAAAAARAEAKSLSDEFRLRLQNLHTGESLDIVYRVGDTYVPEALEKLDYFLRDHNTNDVIRYDPREFDVLHAVMQRLHRTNGVIDIVCGYRTPETNEALREESPNSGVAEHSQHMEGHAIDIRVPGVSTARLRNAALSLHEGGVGYYPVSHFVHVDVGPVRQWTFGRTTRRRKPRHLVARRRHPESTVAGE